MFSVASEYSLEAEGQGLCVKDSHAHRGSRTVLSLCPSLPCLCCDEISLLFVRFHVMAVEIL